MFEIMQDYIGVIYVLNRGPCSNHRTELTYDQCLDLELFGDGSDFDVELAKKYYKK